MKNHFWSKLISWVTLAKEYVLKKKYSPTDIIAMLALFLALYQFYYQNIQQEKEEYEKKFTLIRESADNPKLSDVLLIKEILAELDQEKNYKYMTDIQKEILSLGHSIVGNNRRSFEISKESVEKNLKEKKFESAKLFYDNLYPSALSLGEIDALTTMFEQLNLHYSSTNNLRARYQLNKNYSLGMLEFSAYRNDIDSVIKYMNKFYIYFDAMDFEDHYRMISSRMSPEIKTNPLVIKLDALLLERYRASETKDKAYVKEFLDGMEELFFTNEPLERPTTGN